MIAYRANTSKSVKNLAKEYLPCLLYTSDAADDLLFLDLGGRRIIQKTRIDYSARRLTC